MTSFTVYEDAGKWFFHAFNTEFGPYEDEQEAWDNYEKLMNSKDCPSCEE